MNKQINKQTHTSVCMYKISHYNSPMFKISLSVAQTWK